MKNVSLAILLLLAATRLAAQPSHAYDPNYVDFSAKMDTLRRIAVDNFNMGLLNDDSFDDLALTDYYAARSAYQYGGPLLFDSVNGLFAPFTLPILRGDFNGDGMPSIIAHFEAGSAPFFYRGISDYPYFDTASVPLRTRDYEPGTDGPGIIGSNDCNLDGTPDIIAVDGAPGFVDYFIYYGGTRFNDTSSLYPNDSTRIVRDSNWYGATAGVYSKGGTPLLFVAQSDKTSGSIPKEEFKIGVFRHLSDLAQDSIVYLSHTTEAVQIYHPGTDSMIAATGLYTMDITGDGIPDLLVTDGVYIYIFKGTDSLGYYPLTKDRAYYRIPHPALLEGLTSDWSYIDQWGFQLFNCGDMTGSGDPVLGVVGRSSTSGDYDAVFFYCGGKALDSLFDGLLQKNAAFDGGYDNLDTLHSIDSTGRSAVLVPVDNFDFLLYRDGDKMPHQTNPLWLTVRSSEGAPPVSMSAFPAIANRYVRIHAVSPTSVFGNLTIFDLLGHAIASRNVEIDAGDNTEYFETSGWTSGTYIARLSAGSVDDRSSAKVSTTRFIVQH